MSDAPATPVLEYRSGVDDAHPWTRVWTARDYFEANLAVAKLHEHGIHARVDMEHAQVLGPWGGTGAAGSNVHVQQHDVEAARAILEEVERQQVQRRAQNVVACPRCHAAPASGAVHPLRKLGLALTATIPLLAGINLLLELQIGHLLFPLALPTLFLLVWPFAPRWRCPGCACQWSQPEPDEGEEEE